MRNSILLMCSLAAMSCALGCLRPSDREAHALFMALLRARGSEKGLRGPSHERRLTAAEARARLVALGKSAVPYLLDQLNDRSIVDFMLHSSDQVGMPLSTPRVTYTTVRQLAQQVLWQIYATALADDEHAEDAQAYVNEFLTRKVLNKSQQPGIVSLLTGDPLAAGSELERQLFILNVMGQIKCTDAAPALSACLHKFIANSEEWKAGPGNEFICAATLSLALIGDREAALACVSYARQRHAPELAGPLLGLGHVAGPIVPEIVAALKEERQLLLNTDYVDQYEVERLVYLAIDDEHGPSRELLTKALRPMLAEDPTMEKYLQRVLAGDRDAAGPLRLRVYQRWREEPAVVLRLMRALGASGSPEAAPILAEMIDWQKGSIPQGYTEQINEGASSALDELRATEARLKWIRHQ